jgi:hypothetical protein
MAKAVGGGLVTLRIRGGLRSQVVEVEALYCGLDGLFHDAMPDASEGIGGEALAPAVADQHHSQARWFVKDCIDHCPQVFVPVDDLLLAGLPANEGASHDMGNIGR